MTATVTVHVIGKCPAKGCRHRVRHTLPGVVRVDRFGTRTVWGIPAGDGYGTVSPHPSYSDPPSRYPTGHRYERAWLAAMRAAGWICEQHDRFLRPTVVKGTANVDKTCDGRCMGATGPNCECSCGGANHGAAYDFRS